MTMRDMTPWGCLGVPEDATREQIDAAYRKLATRYHPDKAQRSDMPELAAIEWRDPWCPLVWRWIEGAYKLLTDDTALAAYQCRRRHAPQPKQPQPRAPRVAPEPDTVPAPATDPHPFMDEVVTPLVDEAKRKMGATLMDVGRGVLEGAFDWLTNGRKPKA